MGGLRGTCLRTSFTEARVRGGRDARGIEREHTKPSYEVRFWNVGREFQNGFLGEITAVIEVLDNFNGNEVSD
jgi:hypothetical protein